MSVEFLLTPGFVNGSPIGRFQAAFGISFPPHAEGPKSKRTREPAICDHRRFFIGPPGDGSELFRFLRLPVSASPAAQACDRDTGVVAYRRRTISCLRWVSSFADACPRVARS